MSTESKFTPAMLSELQSYPLEIKVRLTKQRIREWVNHFGIDGVYVSFSGGKDSTVLLDIVRQEYPEIPGVFIDTGLEYPEIREHVKKFDNITWVKPRKNFKQVVETYGLPVISKKVARVTKAVQRFLWKKCEEDPEFKRRYEAGEIPMEEFEEMFSMHATGVPAAGKVLFGTLEHGNTGEPSYMLNHRRHKYLVKAPFKISDHCCDVMKKQTAHAYVKETGRHCMTAVMASESELRKRSWLARGCNAFDIREPVSNPMAFWTDQDVLQYIKENDIPMASVYGETVKGLDGKLRTTGRDRTGCMFCLFGCHLERESRFQQMKETHPHIYEWLMKPVSEGGMGYKEVIDWLNENGNLNIKY